MQIFGICGKCFRLIARRSKAFSAQIGRSHISAACENTTRQGKVFSAQVA
jgi:hypothetical protein